MIRRRLVAASSSVAVVAGALAMSAAPVATAADVEGGWTPVVDAATTAPLSNKVYSLLQDGSTVYVGGMFTGAGGAAGSYLTSFNAATAGSWTAVTSSALSAGSGYTYVATIAKTGSDLYIGGRFGGGNIAKVASNGTVSSLGSGSSGGEVDVEEIAIIGTKVFAGGGFNQLGSTSNTEGIGVWDTSAGSPAWAALGGGLDGSQDIVNGLLADGTTLYLGGQFTGLDGTASNRAVSWNTATPGAVALGDGFNGGLVASFAKSSSGSVTGLFAGGNMTTAGASTAINGIAKLSGSNWVAGGGTGLSSGGTIETMAFDASGNLYVGGSFTSVNGVAANNIAKYDGTTWSALTCGPNNGVNAAVRGILPQSDGSIIIGGWFTNAGGFPNNDYLARHTPGTGTCPYSDGGSGGSSMPQVTIDIDYNGGDCTVDKIQDYQGTWTKAPGAGVAPGEPGYGGCIRYGYEWVGFNTSPNGSGLAIAKGGNLLLSGDNRIYAIYEAPRLAGPPTNVVAKGAYKKVTVSWKAPTDTGSSPIAAYLVRTTPGDRACITNQASANMLECSYTDLVPGTKYTFAVQALNRAGWGNFSAASNQASPYDLLLDTVSRPEVKFLFFKRGSNLEAAGRAPGLEAGTVLTPVLQVGADGAFVPQTSSAAKVNADGDFTWSKKLDKNVNGKPASLYFTYADVKTATLTAKLGATIGLPSVPRDLKVKSDTSGITVSWQPPARDGGSPILEYVMTSDLRAPSWAQSRFVSCTVKAPTTSCTMPGSTTVFDPKKEYSFSVVAKTERGTSPEAKKKWKGELYRLNIFKRARIDSEILLSFSAVGWPKDAGGFVIEAKVGENGTWKKQGTAQLDPDYVESIGDWQGMLPRSVTAGSEVFYRVKSDKGYSNVVRFRLSSTFEYSVG